MADRQRILVLLVVSLLALAVLAVLVNTVPFLRPRAVVTGVGAAVTVECADPSPVVDRAALGLTPGGRR